MKKITIAAISALMLGAAQAEYTIRLPLELAQGGSLPNGSIKLKAQSNSSGTFECLGVAGLWRVYFTCDNGVIVGTVAGREITGTCQGNTYTATYGGRTHSGTCGVD